MVLFPALLTGLVLSGLLSVLIFGSLAYNPRLWLHHAPKEIVEAVPPLRETEKKHRLVLGLVFFALLLGAPLVGIWQLQNQAGSLGYWQTTLFLWIVWMTFNLVDLVLIDWPIVALRPGMLYPPGVDHLIHLNTYQMHLVAFVKGSIGITLASPLFAGLSLLL